MDDDAPYTFTVTFSHHQVRDYFEAAFGRKISLVKAKELLTNEQFRTILAAEIQSIVSWAMADSDIVAEDNAPEEFLQFLRRKR